MPFKSEEQRKWMHQNLPDIADRWEKEYKCGGKLEGKLVTCPNHGWQFDVTDGKCVSLDLCDDGAFVETYPVKIENDEIILSLP